MERRPGHTPMDFQYDNSGGPLDPQSPFNTNAPRLNSFKNQARSSASSRLRAPISPTRDPPQQSYPFPQTPKMKPSGPSFTGIRENENSGFSSGAENPSSPDYADNDDTPEAPAKTIRPALSENITVFRGSKSPKKRSLSSIFNFTKKLSPIRTEVAQKSSSDALARRVHKRKRQEFDRERELRSAVRRTHYESDVSDSDSRPGHRNNNRTAPSAPAIEMGYIPSFFSLIEKHPNVPSILSYWIQFVINAVVGLCVIYAITRFFLNFYQDINHKSQEAIAATLADMALCAREYVENRCDRSQRVPAMETVCNGWERCMNQDPNRVGRAKLSMHTVAEIFNEFVDKLSNRTLIVVFLGVFLCFGVTNMAFGWLRTNVLPHPPLPAMHHVPHPQQPPPPQLQSQQHYYGDDQFYTPYQHRGGLPASGAEFGGDSPTKRLGYR